MSDKYLITCSGQAEFNGKRGHVSFSSAMEPKDWQYLQAEIGQRADEGYVVWQLDLDYLAQADSPFIGALVRLNSAMRDMSCDMEVILPKDSPVTRTFTRLKLDRLLGVCYS